MTPAATTGTVVLLDSRLGAVVPAAALPAIRAADAVYRTAGLPLDSVAPAPPDLPAAGGSVVLLASSLDDPEAAALHAAGAEVTGRRARPAASCSTRSR